MAISLASLRTSTSLTPPRVLTYGVAGVGKTLFATSAPRPAVIQTEDGLGTISAATSGPASESAGSSSTSIRASLVGAK